MNNQLKILKKEFDNHSKSFNTAIIYLENEEVKQDYFNFLHKILNDSNSLEEVNPVVPMYGNYLSRIARDIGASCRIVCTNKDMIVSYNSPGVIQYIDYAQYLTDDEFDDVIRKDIPPFRPFKLRNSQEVELFYPEIFNKKNKVL